MGMTIRELLNEEYFSGMRVIAGQEGTGRQVSGLAILDAPDGLDWARGSELVLSSGYVFAAREGLFDELIRQKKLERIAALGIKMRFFDRIPDHVLAYFNQQDIPLLVVPEECSWPESIFQFNMLVFNNALHMFDIHEGEISASKTSPYDEGKIARILSRIEYATKRPAMLYDRLTEEQYHSSSKFKKRSLFARPEDYVNDSLRIQKETLSVRGHMSIYEMPGRGTEDPVRWMVSPLVVNNQTDAYLIVLQGREPLNSIDRMTLRVGQSLLRNIYERKRFSILLQDTHFRNLVHDCIDSKGVASKKILALSKEYAISLYGQYCLVYMEQPGAGLSPDDLRRVKAHLAPLGARQVQLGELSCLFLIPVGDDSRRVEQIKELAGQLPKRTEASQQTAPVQFGVALIPEPLLNTGENLARCRRSVSVGRRLTADRCVHFYSDLGPFAWIDVHEEMMESLVRDLRDSLPQPEDADELLHTLKTYLACRMNYSLTAQEFFVHINTVRKRIETVRAFISYDLDNPFDRLKLELILALFDGDSLRGKQGST